MDNLVAQVIGDVALVMLLCSLLGGLASRLGQPRVIGQIVAGILLGPTLLGHMPGELPARLFSQQAVAALTTLADVAVVIFMFVVGYEMDRRFLRARWRAASLIALAAFALPMIGGVAMATAFRSGFAALGQRGGASFTLFLGVAVSVTALPVMAAIIREHGIAGTPAGVIAASAGGIMDVAAWLVLAAVLAGTHSGTGRPPVVTLLLTGGFTAVMLFAVRPALIRLAAWRSSLSGQLPLALTLALGSAWVTGFLGLHPVFGGFLAGLAMPHPDGGPDADVLRPLDNIADLLLPLFFVVTGLSLDIGALPGTAFALLALVCVIAIGGKLVPAYAASRVSGLPPGEAGTVAALINARGLTELIALNVGLSTGVISRPLYTVLVLMALITTGMTAPLLSLISKRVTGTPKAAAASRNAITPTRS
jgi:Kef-type K+ transport system membrane component KefB